MNCECGSGDPIFQDGLCYTCWLESNEILAPEQEITDLLGRHAPTTTPAPVGTTPDQIVISRIDEEPPQWDAALRPFLRVGDTCILVAPRGAGKSILTLEIAQAYACRDLRLGHNPWLDGWAAGSLFKAELQGPTLILDADNDAHDWGTLLQQSFMAYNIPANSEIRPLCGDHIHHTDASQFGLNRPQTREEGVQRLLETIARGDYRLVILDYLWRIFKFDSNDIEWTSALGDIRAECRKMGVNVIAISQPPMGELSKQLAINNMRPWGTTQQENITDVILNLKAHAKSGIKLFVSKRRFGPQVGTSETVQFRKLGAAGYSKTERKSWIWEEQERGGFVIPLLTPKQEQIIHGLPKHNPWNLKETRLRAATARQFIAGYLIPNGYVTVDNPEAKGQGVTRLYRWSHEGIKLRHALHEREEAM